MIINKIYYEPKSLDFELGKRLLNHFSDKEWIPIESHNNIPELRNNPNSEFNKMKQNLIIGIRKTHKYIPNHKISDFLVPYTSSGCSAMCLYCYLVCNYNKCSYLRVFVNREYMLDKLIKFSNSDNTHTFEIGSNSDLILENTITDNLPWTIENFARKGKGAITFPTKFHMVEPILNLNHQGKTIFRMSVNPKEIIKKIEFGTSSLTERIKAINEVHHAGYPVGILIAPVIFTENWKTLYLELIQDLSQNLTENLKKNLSIEVIFMTYSYIHRMINKDAFPNAKKLYDKDLMTGRGYGRYCYKQSIREEGKSFFKEKILQYFPNANLIYIV